MNVAITRPVIKVVIVDRVVTSVKLTKRTDITATVKPLQVQ